MFKLKTNQITTEETIPVMWDDGYSDAHSLQFNNLTESKSEIESNVLDIITSKKGAATIRMLESLVTPSSFETGFQVNIIIF